MRNSIFILTVLFPFFTFGQTTIEKSLPAHPGDELYLNFKYADKVNISTWEKNEVHMVAEVMIDEGERNELYKIDALKEGNRLEISSDPEAIESISETIYHSDDCCRRYGLRITINIEINLPPYMHLDFESISGSITVPELAGKLNLNTISGDITIQPNSNAFMVKSISGDLEILIDKAYGADLKAKTISGEIYSNLESLHIEDKRGLRQIVGQSIKGQINQGGEDWKLETISGDIFLRQI